MAGRLPDAFIDDLLARTDIVDLISRRVQLRKAGKDYQARCPFHNEKTPSFTVSPTKQFYHCFGCGAHGTAIGFLMEHDRLSFREAVEELAQQAGLPLPDDAQMASRGPNLAPLRDTLAHAAALYQQQLLRHPEGRRARDYLAQRGVNDEIIERFGLGWAPSGWRFLLERLGRGADETKRLADAGLLAEQNGHRYDRFRERIMFPIRDSRGQIVGFGGRVLGDEKPKYLNSPETALFHKGRQLYGLYEAYQAQRSMERLLIVEGYMDVIALAQFGIPYVVATLGTATTADHLKRLQRSAPELVFCFDGDRAGRDAAWKALQAALPLATGQQQLRFLFLPQGEDPDTLVRRDGQDGLLDRIAQAVPLSDFLFLHLSEEVSDLSTAEGRARLAFLAEPLLKVVPNGVYKQLLTDRLAALARLPSRYLAGPSEQRRRSTSRPARLTLTPMRLAIALLLQQPGLAAEVVALPSHWRHLPGPGTALLVQILEILDASPDLSAAALLERWRDSANWPHLARLSDPGLTSHIPAEGVAAELRGALSALNRQATEQVTHSLFAKASPKQWTDAEKELIRSGLTTKTSPST